MVAMEIHHTLYGIPPALSGTMLLLNLRYASSFKSFRRTVEDPPEVWICAGSDIIVKIFTSRYWRRMATNGDSSLCEACALGGSLVLPSLLSRGFLPGFADDLPITRLQTSGHKSILFGSGASQATLFGHDVSGLQGLLYRI